MKVNIKLRYYILIYVLFINLVSLSGQDILVDQEMTDQYVNKTVVEDLKSDKSYAYIYDEVKEKGFLGRAWDDFKSYIARMLRAANEATGSSLVTFLIVIVSIFVLVYFFLRSQRIGFFEKQSKTIEFSLIDGTTVDASADLDQLLQEANASADYKKAVQLIYLKSLFYLGDEEVIDVKKFKTNADYLKEISLSGIQTTFRGITNQYEHTQFGDFEATTENVDEMNAYFSNLTEVVGK